MKYLYNDHSDGLVERCTIIFDMVDDCETPEERLQYVKSLLTEVANNDYDFHPSILKTIEIVSRNMRENEIMKEVGDEFYEKYSNKRIISQKARKETLKNK